MLLAEQALHHVHDCAFAQGEDRAELGQTLLPVSTGQADLYIICHRKTVFSPPIDEHKLRL